MHKDCLQIVLHPKGLRHAHEALDQVRRTEQGVSRPTAHQPVFKDPPALACFRCQHLPKAAFVSASLLGRSLELFRLSRTGPRLIHESQVAHEVLLQAFKNLLLSQEGHGELGDLCEDSPAELGGQGAAHDL